jgi:hypothetical protein
LGSKYTNTGNTRAYGAENPINYQIMVKNRFTKTDILQEFWDGITPSKKETPKIPCIRLVRHAYSD